MTDDERRILAHAREVGRAVDAWLDAKHAEQLRRLERLERLLAERERNKLEETARI